MSLVHAAFSWRDGAKRTTENGGPSGGSTTILNSRWLKPWPAALSGKKTEKTQGLFPRCHSLKTAVGTQLGRARLLTVLVAGVQLLDESAFDQRERSSLLLAKNYSAMVYSFTTCIIRTIGYDFQLYFCC